MNSTPSPRDVRRTHRVRSSSRQGRRRRTTVTQVVLLTSALLFTVTTATMLPPQAQAEPLPAPRASSTTGAVELALSRTRLAAGEEVTVMIAGLGGGAQAALAFHSDPVDMGTVVAAADGTATLTWRVPVDTSPGDHEIVLVPEEGTSTAVDINVVESLGSGDGATADPAAEGALLVASLATTGGVPDATGAALSSATALLLAGGALLTVRRMRRG